jgi:uncharacterized membrane protein YkgB
LRNLVQTTVGLVLERTERNGCPRREWRKRRRAASYRLSITVVIVGMSMSLGVAASNAGLGCISDLNLNMLQSGHSRLLLVK